MNKVKTFCLKHAYGLAISLFAIALIVQTTYFVGHTVGGFSFYETLMFAFEFLLHFVLIFSLFKKNSKVTNILIVLIKMFEATYYIASICIKADELMQNPFPLTTFELLNFIAYSLAAFFLLLILVLFIFYKVTGKRFSWKLMKIIMLIVVLVMLLTTVAEIINLAINSGAWYAFLEPLYVAFLVAGMFCVCHFIDERN